MEHIYKCPSCNSYTLSKECSSCHISTVLPRPPKFSLEDAYSDYRRRSRKEELLKKGLL